jgi:hypothetical protein
MKNYLVKSLLPKPGIQRDGTPFASQSYIDGQHCRFYMGRPRKIGGYKLIDVGNTDIIRSLFEISQSPIAPPNTINVYYGRKSSVSYNTFDFNGNGLGEVDRTPVDYTANDNNVWDFDLFSAIDSEGHIKSWVVGSVIPNGNDISNNTAGLIYYGSTLDNSKFVQTTPHFPSLVTGGILFVSPFLVAYGDNGLLQWTQPNDIADWTVPQTPPAPPLANYLVISNDKIIYAARTRGSTAPQFLCWTLSALINVTFDPSGTETGSGAFSASTIDNITIMSPNSVVQYKQQFFWIGTNQFYYFNGIVQPLDNSMSTDWFFDYVNLNQRAKVWGILVERYNEIWWHYPRNSSPGANDQIECNAVIIYNVSLNTWYDTSMSRAAGLPVGLFPYPIMSDSVMESISSGRGIVNNYGLWMHEYGVDQVIGENNFAIKSYFETNITTLFEGNPQLNRLLRSRRIEPDFAQEGEMTVTVNNRMFASDTLANGRLIQSGPYPFTPDTPKIDDISSQGRLASYLFTSNVSGGNYQGGETLLDYEVGDVNPSP